MGYKPNLAARALSAGRVPIRIGVSIPREFHRDFSISSLHAMKSHSDKSPHFVSTAGFALTLTTPIGGSKNARVVLFFLLVFAQGSLLDLKGQGLLRSEHLRVIQGTPLEKDYQEMVFNHLLRLVKEATQKRLARLEAIRSEADFRTWKDANRQKFLGLIGGLPAERTSLNPHVTGELKRDDYVIRKVILESLPDYYVTANLYMPTNGKPPYPGVLCPLGHSRNGKAYDEYQRLFVGLVRRGYVVLAYDSPGQGERIQYWDFLTNQRGYQFRSNEHGLYGVQECLLGQNLARYMIWDGIRALDYLTGLPEVDATRIGVTGNSGGGALTTYISMLDSRVRVAARARLSVRFPGKLRRALTTLRLIPSRTSRDCWRRELITLRKSV